MIRKKRYIVISIFLALTAYGVQTIRQALSTINICEVHVDAALSQVCTQLLSERVRQLSHEHPSQIFACVQKEYPCVKSFSCRYDARHVMTVTLGAAIPMVRLNDQQLILENKQCVPAVWYNDSHVQVPQVTTTSENSIQSIITFFEQVPAVMSKRFNGEWRTDYDIRLHDTMHKDAVLVASVDAVPTIDTLKAYDNIIEEYKKYTIHETEKNEKWIADARFTNQLIFSTQKREA